MSRANQEFVLNSPEESKSADEEVRPWSSTEKKFERGETENLVRIINGAN